MISRLPLSATRTLAHSTQCSAPTYSTRLATATTGTLLTPSNLQPLQRQPRSCSFTTTPGKLEDNRSNYDILGVPPTVTKADLKKRFYVLSKETHPDVNPNNPNASARFAEVSEAYAILGNEEKRKRYDRDVMPRFARSASRSSHAGRTRSGTYAGSRPATGLSTRRGTFRGPPPSFYARGRGGSQEKASDEEQARRDRESYTAGTDPGPQAGQFDSRAYASPGQWDPAFNPEPVYRTQTAEDTRRQQRRAAEMAAAQAYAEQEGDFLGRFLVVSGVVAIGVGVGTIVHNLNASPKGGLLRGDGSRRKVGAGR